MQVVSRRRSEGREHGRIPTLPKETRAPISGRPRVYSFRIGYHDPNSLYFHPIDSIRVDFSLLDQVVLASKLLQVDDTLIFLLDG